MIIVVTDLQEAKQKREAWNTMLSKYERQFIWDDSVPDFDDNIEQKKPSITFFKAKNASPKHGCVLIIPGGCYLYKSTNESVNVAQKINSAGIDAAILDYRTVPYERSVILKDAKRAMRYLRYNSKSMGFCEDKIAIMGFSAGGNLAMLCAISADSGNKDSDDEVERVSSTPNALLLCYPAVNLVDRYQEKDCFSLLSYFDIVIDKEPKLFPPTFIWNSMEDEIINYRASMELATRLNKMNVPVELHLFPYGGHGQSLAFDKKGEVNPGDNKLTSCWSDLCIRWLSFYGFNFKEEQYEI